MYKFYLFFISTVNGQIFFLNLSVEEKEEEKGEEQENIRKFYIVGEFGNVINCFFRPIGEICRFLAKFSKPVEKLTGNDASIDIDDDDGG